MTKRKTDKWWLAELNINTKKQLMEGVRAIVDKYRDNQVLNPFDEVWILKILRHHSEYKQKVGCGIQHLEVRTNKTPQGTSRGFWIVRKDGTAVDISWCVALNPQGCLSIKQNVANAARYEVHPQIREHRTHGECDVCSECQQPMSKREDVHVDHVNTFDSLLNQFMQEHDLRHEQIIVEDLGLQSQFEDRTLGCKWQNFHREHATLRIIHASCNLKRKVA
jgi:hypothetical protein